MVVVKWKSVDQNFRTILPYCPACLNFYTAISWPLRQARQGCMAKARENSNSAKKFGPHFFTTHRSASDSTLKISENPKIWKLFWKMPWLGFKSRKFRLDPVLTLSQSINLGKVKVFGLMSNVLNFHTKGKAWTKIALFDLFMYSYLINVRCHICKNKQKLFLPKQCT